MRWTEHLKFDKSEKAVKNFGLILSGLLVAYATYKYLFEHQEFGPLISIAAILSVFSIFFQMPIRVIYYPWMVVVRIIGFFIMHILLAIVFYIVITPIGLIRRLRKKQENNEATYWISRDNESDMERMF